MRDVRSPPDLATSNDPEIQWAKRWGAIRARGRNHFVLRFFLVNGLIPGIVGSSILAFVHPRVGDQDLSEPLWLLVAFVCFCAYGFWLGRRWWRISESRFNEHNRKASVGS